MNYDCLSNLRTDPALLAALAKPYQMSRAEVMEQRVSFIYGQLPVDSPITKDQIYALVA